MKKKQRLEKPPTSKRRKNRQRAKRKATTEVSFAIGAVRKRLRADAPVTAVRRVAEGEIAIGIRRGLFGHPGTVLLRINDASIVGCVEDKAELAKFVNNVGLLVTAQLFKHSLADGIEDLGKSIAKWAGIDLEALAKAAAEEDPESISDFSPGANSNYRCPTCACPVAGPEALAAHTCPVLNTDDVTSNETTPVL